MDHTTKTILEKITSSVHFDCRLAAFDVECTAAHVDMLAKQNILSEAESEELLSALKSIATSVGAGTFLCMPDLEDVHSNVEFELQRRVGELAGKIGAARGRNDLSVTALRMWVRKTIDEIVEKLVSLVQEFVIQAQKHAETVMPGMTHLQAAQPISFGHLNLAYAEMFVRDIRRFTSAREWLNECPLGACALAGTSFDIDRKFTAEALGFVCPTANSIDSVADRDFVLDFLSACVTFSIHASRFTEDMVIWLTPEFNFVSLPEFLAGKSAVMPHKKNPDAMELVRAKSGRIIGNLNAVQIMLKGLSMSYCRDLQEDKEPVFDSADSVLVCLDVLILVARHLGANTEVMASAANAGFTTSTDYADWITQKENIPFRTAHHMVADLVGLAGSNDCGLADLSMTLRSSVDPRLGAADWPAINADRSMRSRRSQGGTAPERVTEAAGNLAERVAALRVKCVSVRGEAT